MSESGSYTEQQLESDIKKQAAVFRCIFNREVQNIRKNILTDFRVPRQGWDQPYLNVVELCSKVDKDTAPLVDAILNAQLALKVLDDLAEDELVDVQSRLGSMLDSMENVR